MSSSELLVVFSFAEKAFNQNSKRLSNQALFRLRRVSNSFFKFSKRCLPCLHSLLKTSAEFVRILEQVKNLDWPRWKAGEKPRRFSSGYEGRENMFYFLSESFKLVVQ